MYPQVEGLANENEHVYARFIDVTDAREEGGLPVLSQHNVSSIPYFVLVTPDGEITVEGVGSGAFGDIEKAVSEPDPIKVISEGDQFKYEDHLVSDAHTLFLYTSEGSQEALDIYSSAAKRARETDNIFLRVIDLSSLQEEDTDSLPVTEQHGISSAPYLLLYDASGEVVEEGKAETWKEIQARFTSTEVVGYASRGEEVDYREAAVEDNHTVFMYTADW